jgi:hypothetical protein
MYVRLRIAKAIVDREQSQTNISQTFNTLQVFFPALKGLTAAFPVWEAAHATKEISWMEIRVVFERMLVDQAALSGEELDEGVVREVLDDEDWLPLLLGRCHSIRGGFLRQLRKAYCDAFCSATDGRY